MVKKVCVFPVVLSVVSGINSCRRQRIYADSTTTVRLKDNQILIVKFNDTYGAVQLLDCNDNSGRYKWWLLGKGEDDFSAENIESGESEVFEKYVEIGKDANGGIISKDAGSVLFIEFGEFAIEWSASNWLYVDSEYDYRILDIGEIFEVGKVDW
ncbi:MAG: hypothetical protein JXD22_12135 [Sedimentisphaerales bacterium]|nr:hypothetical protein [Sedimentisphaerales bacterium]